MKSSLLIKAAIGLTVGLVSVASPALGAPYEIKKGDTFWKLSIAHNIPLSAVLEANPGVNPRNLQIGQIVNLPIEQAAGKPTAAASSVAPSSMAAPSTVNRPVVMNAKAAAAQNTVSTPSGQTYAFKKKIDAVASAYSASAEENGGWAGLDYFGNQLKLGTVAVDPKVIPLGSKLFVTGYSFSGLPEGGMIATASDVGGAIKGNRIDLFIPGSSSYVKKFGIQNVQVYILE